MALDIAAQIRYWRKGAAEEIEVAKVLLDGGKLRQAGFFIHLAIEKMLKAEVVVATSDLAPRTHDLLSLASRAGIILSKQQEELLVKVQAYCMEGRYPGDPRPVPSVSELAQHLTQVQEMIAWLQKQSKIQ